MSNPTNNKVANRDVNAAQRAAMAIALRRQKVKLDDIAAQCGYASAGAVHNAIRRELDRVVVDNVEMLRKEECDMLDELHYEMWQLFKDRDNPQRLFAVDRILAISARRCKLMGLDIPVESDVPTNTVVIREVPSGYLGEVKG